MSTMLTWWSIRFVSKMLGCCKLTDKVTRWKPKWKINSWKSLFDLCCLLDSGGDAKVPDARGWELTGVQVRDMLHDLVEGINVVTLHSQRGLAGVELHLRGEIKVNICFFIQCFFPKALQCGPELFALLTLTAEATSSGSCTSSPSLQVYKQSITFLFSSLPERIISPARFPRKNWAIRAFPPGKCQDTYEEKKTRYKHKKR